jgi:uncharacterized LabA/DUF88 family protein
MPNKPIIFIDRENLIFRYQNMLKAGWQPRQEVIHEIDCCVWHPSIGESMFHPITRVLYYTAITGDQVRLEHVKQQLAAIQFQRHRGTPEQIVPKVFSKSKQNNRTKSVDINLTIDVLRFAQSETIDGIILISGDGDYLPLVQEVMRTGKQIYVGALSSGLRSELTYSADGFFNLDHFFFERNKK